MKELQLKDIKPIVDINDNSLLILIALIAAVLIVVGIVSYFLYKKYVIKQRRYKKSETYRAKEALKNLDYSNTKEAVYNFSKYAQYLANKSQQERLEAILQELEKYKFKKDIDNLSNIDKQKIKSFIKEIV